LLEKIGITWLTSSLVYLLLNVGLFFFALKALGKKFAIKAIVGILAFSGAMELFALIPLNITYEPLISAVYGGGLMGVGLGIVVRFGGSTGGSDLVACIVKNKKPNLTIGKIVVIIDMMVIFLSLFAFNNGMELLPYTIVALMIALYGTDFVNEGYKQVRAYYIVTQKPEEVSAELMSKLSRGCTATKVTGMHQKEERYILTCLVSKFQTATLKRIVAETDEKAFVYSGTVGEVMGSWAKKSELPEIEKSKNSKTKSTEDKKVTKKAEKTTETKVVDNEENSK
jgi:uncharacterized membrane-anchored protein YitT (DUF2179 family)